MGLPILVPLMFAELVWAKWGPWLKSFSKLIFFFFLNGSFFSKSGLSFLKKKVFAFFARPLDVDSLAYY